MHVEDNPLTTGGRLRQIRYARGKSLRVIAGLAGMSKSHLSQLERGERALDSRSETVALANALGIAPSDLTELPIPAPGDGHTDSAIEAVRRALMAVNHDHAEGQVLPVDALRERVAALVGAVSIGDQELTGSGLPVLIRDLHTTTAAGRDVPELLDLTVLLHTQGPPSRGCGPLARRWTYESMPCCLPGELPRNGIRRPREVSPRPVQCG